MAVPPYIMALSSSPNDAIQHILSTRSRQRGHALSVATSHTGQSLPNMMRAGPKVASTMASQLNRLWNSCEASPCMSEAGISEKAPESFMYVLGFLLRVWMASRQEMKEGSEEVL